MESHKIIVIGSSAGGVEALITLARGLPKSFVPPICITQHLSATKESALADILARSGNLPVVHPRDGMELQGGTIYLAPPGQNMSLSVQSVLLTPVPLQQPSSLKSTPSIDLLFASAALSYGVRVIGVILTGLLTDGTVGMQLIKHLGGTTIIENPLSAHYPDMPRSVQVSCSVDYCQSLEQIAPLLHILTS